MAQGQLVARMAEGKPRWRDVAIPGGGVKLRRRLSQPPSRARSRLLPPSDPPFGSRRHNAHSPRHSPRWCATPPGTGPGRNSGGPPLKRPCPPPGRGPRPRAGPLPRKRRSPGCSSLWIRRVLANPVLSAILRAVAGLARRSPLSRGANDGRDSVPVGGCRAVVARVGARVRGSFCDP